MPCNLLNPFTEFDMKQLVPGIKNSQKLRVVVDGVGLHMTVKDACLGFATHSHAVAVYCGISSLVRYNYNNSVPIVGHVGTWNGHTVQIDIVKDSV
jgi:hypothetical protein